MYEINHIRINISRDLPQINLTESFVCGYIQAMKGAESETKRAALETQRAAFDLEGATCMSCVYAIEHEGRNLEGVRDVYVDVATKKIHVEYDGRRDALDRITEIVEKIGYRATLSTNR